jgi:hypothetical protein
MKKLKRFSVLSVSFAAVFAVYLLQTVYVLQSLPDIPILNSNTIRTSSFLETGRKQQQVAAPDLLPLQQVWKDYQQWHSQQALEQELLLTLES